MPAVREQRTARIKRGRIFYIIERGSRVTYSDGCDSMELGPPEAHRLTRRGARRIAKRWLRSTPSPQLIETLEAEWPLPVGPDPGEDVT